MPRSAAHQYLTLLYSLGLKTAKSKDIKVSCSLFIIILILDNIKGAVLQEKFGLFYDV